jgi:enoyl-CoA hydratase/carnithine racemase
MKAGYLLSTLRAVKTLRQSRTIHTHTHLKISYEFIKAEVRENKVGLITLHRPKALNALCDGLLKDLVHAASAFDNDDAVGAIVITGSEKAFAAGADIKEMVGKTYAESYTSNMFRNWTDITKVPFSGIKG